MLRHPQLSKISTKYKKILDFSRKCSNRSYDVFIDEAALQKRLWTIAIAETFTFNEGLDLFGGLGHSGYILSKCCKHVTIIEKDKDNFRLLKENLRHIKNVTLLCKDNIDYLQTCNKTFDYIDFDPHGNPNMQLAFLNKIFKKGIVCITSGEILQITRNLPGSSLFSREDLAKYKGKKALYFPEEVYIPYIEEQFDLKCIAFYVYPSTMRLILTRKFNTHKIKFEGGRYLGWFKKYVKKFNQHEPLSLFND